MPNLSTCCITVLALCCMYPAAAQENLCPSTNKSREWSSSCIENAASGRQIKQQYRKNIHVNRSGYAAIFISAPPEMIAVSKTGKIVPLARKHLADFVFKRPDAEISRFGYVSNHGDKDYRFKCGYYRVSKFQVVVPPVYDLCAPMHGGKALVCNDCVHKCDVDGGDCDAPDFLGDEAIVINERNEILEKIKLPPNATNYRSRK